VYEHDTKSKSATRSHYNELYVLNHLKMFKNLSIWKCLLYMQLKNDQPISFQHFAICFVWLWNVVSSLEGRTWMNCSGKYFDLRGIQQVGNLGYYINKELLQTCRPPSIVWIVKSRKHNELDIYSWVGSDKEYIQNFGRRPLRKLPILRSKRWEDKTKVDK
jgi:hypothetical protein